MLCFLVVALASSTAWAQARQETPDPGVNRIAAAGVFLAGAAVGLAAHEGGHLFFDVVFDADPGIRAIDFHGIPFFAISHRDDLSPRREFAVSSAGFWVQHAVNEWLLTRHPRLRQQAAPFKKGVFAFNVLASAAYAGAAFAQTGPDERDTRGMAVASCTNEPWIGALVLAPAVLDVWRYFEPDAKWIVWMSRAVKVGAVLLIVR